MEIKWRGSTSYSGFGTSCFWYIKTLRKMGHKVKLYPVSGSKIENEFNLLLDTNPKIGKDSFKINHFFISGDPDSINYTVWEGLKANEERSLAASDGLEIWTPSKFSRDSFIYNGVEKNIEIIPHGVNTDYFNENINPLLPSDKFTFLFVGTSIKRKNTFKLLEKFYKEFSEEENVRLLVFTDEKMEKLIRENFEIRRHLEIISFPISFKEMGKIYTSSNILLLPSSGEGFGLPVLEAAACGVPSITTKWAGVSEFLGDALYYLPFDRAERYYSHEIGGSFLPKPDFSYLGIAMRELFNDNRLINSLSKKCRKRAKKLSWESACKKINERLREIKVERGWK